MKIQVHQPLAGATRLGFLTAVAVMLVPLLLLFHRHAQAGSPNIIVNSLQDSLNVDGLCKLREAIDNANSPGVDTTSGDCPVGTGNDIIGFSLSGTITLSSPLPAIQKDLTLDGRGQTIALDGAMAFTVLSVGIPLFPGNPTGATLALNDLKIQNGGAIKTGEPSTNGGAGIYNAGTLTVTNSTISGNSIPNPGDGGGIFNDVGGVATVLKSTIQGNSAASGGGIWNAGILTVSNSTVSGNAASKGGGIYNGHGNYLDQTTAYGILTVTNSTISNNPVPSGSGGGIYNDSTYGATFKNTIMANQATGGNCFSSLRFTSFGHNLQDDNTCSFAVARVGDLNSTPAGLDPNGLQDNGGPTQTIALLPTSSAVDAVPTSPIDYCTEIDGATPIAGDQRGEPRPDPEDGPDGNCDIGAFELQIATPTPVSGKLRISPKTLNFGDVAVNNSVTKTVTITNAGAVPVTIEMVNTTGSPMPPPPMTSPFTYTTQCTGETLPPSRKGTSKASAMCEVMVQFLPRYTVSYSGALTIKDNLEPSGVQIIQIKGIGEAN